MDRNHTATWLALAAVVVVLLGLAAVWLRPRRTEKSSVVTAPVEQRASGFAVLAGQANTVWKNTAPLADGALVPAGRLQLASGVAQIELFSGVTLVVEGEAEFEILSPMEMSVTRGKVRARVPEPAHGFRIRTAEGEIVDLGTEFALNVSPSNSEVHVLDGEVEWHPRAETMRRMEKGEKDKHIFYSPPFWSASMSGQWLMITTTYDVGARQVTHYVNGRQLSQEAVPAEYLVESVSIGTASICNWGLPERDEPRFAVRNLNGSMDEFALFSAALTAKEIAEIYEHARP